MRRVRIVAGILDDHRMGQAGAFLDGTVAGGKGLLLAVGRQTTVSGTSLSSRPSVAARAATAEQAPVVKPVHGCRAGAWRRPCGPWRVCRLRSCGSLFLLGLGQRQHGVNGGDDQRRAALRPLMATHGTSGTVIIRSWIRQRRQADRHGDDQRQADAFFADQADQFDQRGRRVADADDGAVQFADKP